MEQQAKWRIGLWLSLLAGTIHGIGYALYAYGIWNDTIHTNLVSWSLWALGTVVALWVYGEIAGDWAKVFLNMVCAIGMFSILGLLGYKLWLTPEEYFVLDGDMLRDFAIAVLDIFVVFICFLFRKRSLGVVDGFFQLDIFLSFVPIMLATFADPTGETLLPWALWTVAYFLQYFCVGLRADIKDGEVDKESTKRSQNTPFHYLAWHAVMTVTVFFGGAALF